MALDRHLGSRPLAYSAFVALIPLVIMCSVTAASWGDRNPRAQKRLSSIKDVLNEWMGGWIDGRKDLPGW